MIPAPPELRVISEWLASASETQATWALNEALAALRSRQRSRVGPPFAAGHAATSTLPLRANASARAAPVERPSQKLCDPLPSRDWRAPAAVVGLLAALLIAVFGALIGEASPAAEDRAPPVAALTVPAAERSPAPDLDLAPAPLASRPGRARTTRATPPKKAAQSSKTDSLDARK